MLLIRLFLAFALFSVQEDAVRECVLDCIVSDHDELILEIPQIPSLCEEMGYIGAFIPVGGTSLYVERGGTGTPVVLLHGGPGATHHYFHPHFSAAEGFAEVIYYDQRGCGRSGYFSGKGYSTRQAVNDLDMLRQALGYEEWIVLGHSYGGLLAQMYMDRFPERVSGMVLVCSAVSFELQCELEQGRGRDYISAKEILRIDEIVHNDTLSLAQNLFNRQLAGDWKRQSFFRPTVEETARMVRYEWVQDPCFRRQVFRDSWVFNPDGTALKMSVPVLIIEASWDLTWNTDKPEALREQYPGCEFLMIEDAGHSPFADRPEEFFAELRSFCQSVQQ